MFTVDPIAQGRSDATLSEITMSAGVKNRTSTAVAAAANAILAWGQARRVHEDEAGLTVMTMVLSLAVVLGTIGILLLAYSGGATSDAASAFDSAVAGS